MHVRHPGPIDRAARFHCMCRRLVRLCRMIPSDTRTSLSPPNLFPQVRCTHPPRSCVDMAGRHPWRRVPAALCRSQQPKPPARLSGTACRSCTRKDQLEQEMGKLLDRSKLNEVQRSKGKQCTNAEFIRHFPFLLTRFLCDFAHRERVVQ